MMNRNGTSHGAKLSVSALNSTTKFAFAMFLGAAALGLSSNAAWAAVQESPTSQPTAGGGGGGTGNDGGSPAIIGGGGGGGGGSGDPEAAAALSAGGAGGGGGGGGGVSSSFDDAAVVSSVPLPAAVWAGMASAGGIGIYIKSRRRAAK